MNAFKRLALVAVAGFCFVVYAPRIQAQVSIDVGVAPDCPYGSCSCSKYVGFVSLAAPLFQGTPTNRSWPLCKTTGP